MRLEEERKQLIREYLRALARLAVDELLEEEAPEKKSGDASLETPPRHNGATGEDDSVSATRHAS